MQIKLTHPFLRRCISRQGLLNDCHLLNTFVNRLAKQAETFANGDEDLLNSYKGWGLELFSEYLIKSHPMDKRVGISEYKIADEGDDTGVDGFGIGINGKAATVQVKYRVANWILTANTDHLSNFTQTSMVKYGVDPNDKANMLIITTAKDLHYFTDNEMFLNKVRVLNREKLRVLVDNNMSFWKFFDESWLKSMRKIAKKTAKKSRKKAVKNA